MSVCCFVDCFYSLAFKANGDVAPIVICRGFFMRSQKIFTLRARKRIYTPPDSPNLHEHISALWPTNIFEENKKIFAVLGKDYSCEEGILA